MREVLEALDASKQEALSGEWEDLVHRFNRSRDETMVVPSDYLEAVAIRRCVSSEAMRRIHMCVLLPGSAQIGAAFLEARGDTSSIGPRDASLLQELPGMHRLGGSVNIGWWQRGTTPLLFVGASSYTFAPPGH